MIYILIPIVIASFFWYIFKSDTKNDAKEKELNVDISFSGFDKLFLAPITAETTQDRQNQFNDSFIRYKRNFNAKLQENKRQTEAAMEEKSEVNGVKKEAIQIVDAIQDKKRKGILGVLTQIAEQTKD